MRRAWKIALPLTCAVLIGGTMTFEMVHRHQLEQQRLAEEAQAYRVRAEKGDAEAEFHLSTMYLKGWGVQQNYTEAARWCRKAADQNYAKAQDGMGYLYYHGYGVDGDFAEALRWFHLAADQKNAGAENEIGIAYEVGNGVTASPSEAVRWYQLAADQGYAAAQYNLGRLYAYGYGVPKDRLKARELMTKAADQGYLHAKQMLGRSWPSLSKIQIFELLIGLVGGVFLLTPSLGLQVCTRIAGSGINGNARARSPFFRRPQLAQLHLCRHSCAAACSRVHQTCEESCWGNPPVTSCADDLAQLAKVDALGLGHTIRCIQWNHLCVLFQSPPNRCGGASPNLDEWDAARAWDHVGCASAASEARRRNRRTVRP